MAIWKNDSPSFEIDDEILNWYLLAVQSFWHEQMYKQRKIHELPPEERFRPDRLFQSMNQLNLFDDLPKVCDFQSGSAKHALFLFMAGWISRYGRKANEVIEKVGKCFLNREPDYSGLEKLVSFSKQHPEYVEWWFQNLEKIKDQYDNDVRNIFLTLPVGSPLERRMWLIDRLTSFNGIGHKIAQLMIIWFQGVNWQGDESEWHQINRIPAVPVDIHFLRISYQVGLITKYTNDHRDNIAWPLSTIIAQKCLDVNISWAYLAQGNWLIGSEFCSKARKTKKYQRDILCSSYCPLREICKGIIPYDEDTTKSGRIGFRNLIKHRSVSG